MFKTIEEAADCEIRSVVRFFNVRNVSTFLTLKKVRFITRSVKCMVTMWWVMAWLGNGFGCSRKDERMCTMRRKVSVHLWWMMIWCVRSTRECVMTRFTISDLSLHFPQISRTLLYDIVSSHLGYQKVCAWWVPKMLTEEHKKQRVVCALKFLIRYYKEGDSMLSHTEARHGCPISHLNQSSSPCTGSILARRKGKSSSRSFQQGRSCAPYSGTDKVFSWYNFCPKAQQ